MPWPYGPPPEPLVKTEGPTWICPGDNCQCHAADTPGEEHEVSIVLLAENGERMSSAACRVHHQGRIVNDKENADGDGRITFKLPRAPTAVLVEWAPKDTPIEPRYPYRARYYVEIGKEPRQAARRRLSNLGFWTAKTLEDNVRAFQANYQHPVLTGKLKDIEAELILYHDTAAPPITNDAPSLGKGEKTGTDSFGFAPSAAKAKGAPEDDGKPALTPQAPLAPSPTQGPIKVPSPAVPVDILVDWSFRPGPGGKAPVQSSSFWLEPTTLPVWVGTVDTLGPGWVTDPGIEVPPVKATSSKTQATASLPLGPVLLRMNFELKATVGTETKTVLAFRQLYFLDANGDLLPNRFAIEDYAYARGAAPTPATDPSAPPVRAGSPPVRAKGTGKPVVNGFRIGTGLHPLLRHGADRVPPSDPKKKKKGDVERLTKQIFVNAEMVDATDLWWALHPEEEQERYLHPGLRGRPENLRVLAWTSGKLPMIWFAVVPDRSFTNTETGTGADIVFFRPPPGANSFTHKPNAKAFLDVRHHKASTNKVSTMWMLARFLLSPQTMSALTGAGIGDTSTLGSFADQIQPISVRDENGLIVPDLPAPYISGFNEAFRPCSLEASLARTGEPHVLFLPLASENDGYPGAVRPGLKTVVGSAVLCLWNQCGMARDLPESEIKGDLDDDTPRVNFPGVASRKLWVVGHSAGNLSLSQALNNNGADIDRAISCGATHSSGAIDGVAATLRTAADARGKVGKTIDAFILSAPDMTGTWQLKTVQVGTGKTAFSKATSARGVSMDVAMAKRFFDSGAKVTFLPSFDDQLTHFTIAPATSMSPFLRNLLGQWNNDEIDRSAATPHDWQFLFFHEYPVYGGDRNATTGVVSPLFFQALGPPKPISAAPKQLPP